MSDYHSKAAPIDRRAGDARWLVVGVFRAAEEVAVWQFTELHGILHPCKHNK